MTRADRTVPTVLGADPEVSALGITVLAVLCLVNWQLSHAYSGIFHDAGLYILQGLAHLRPDSLPRDVFLEFGSQDRYTIFGPLFAAATALTQPAGSGFASPEAAAAALTLAFQVGLFAAVWALARTVMPSSPALLAMAVVIAIPGDYGAERVFTCVESFLTPRMAAEALALAGLAATLGKRPALAAVLLVMAVLMHPLMAVAGLIAVFFLFVAAPRSKAGIALLALGALAMALAAWASPAGPWGRFDAHWQSLVSRRSPYLFLSSWDLEDGGRVVVILATLAIGARTFGQERLGLLCRAALMTTALGLALTYVGCDRLHWVPLVRLQPWRWQWLGTLVAALTLPSLLRARWASGQGRACALLLGAAWIFGANGIGLAAALLAAAAMAFERVLEPSPLRLVTWGSWGLLVLAILWRVASNLQFTDAYFIDTHLPMWLRRASSFVSDGSVPIAVLLLAWWLTRTRDRRPALAALGVAAAALGLWVLPHTLAEWTARSYPPALAAQFEPWRRLIPPSAEVFWPESPPAAWMLLSRPHYLSALQTSGMVFSRAAAVELERRADVLAPAVPREEFLDWSHSKLSLALSPAQLEAACALRAFDFLVTRTQLGFEPAAALPDGAKRGGAGLRLYRCRP